jgi:hypothetical protein
MRKSIAYIFLFIGMVLVLIVLLDDNKKSKKIGEEVRQNYRQEISGIVASVRHNRGTIMLRLKDEFNSPYYFEVTRNECSIKSIFLSKSRRFKFLHRS